MSGFRISGWETTSTFDNDFATLSVELKERVKERLALLVENHKAGKLRFEKLQGYSNIYTIHITNDTHHKLSFELRGGIARLRRVGTHKQIDRSP